LAQTIENGLLDMSVSPNGSDPNPVTLTTGFCRPADVAMHRRFGMFNPSLFAVTEVRSTLQVVHTLYVDAAKWPLPHRPFAASGLV
jgi:hypothetical protein